MKSGTIKKKKKRFINEHVVDTIDAIGLADRPAVRLISAVVQSLGFKLKEVVVSRTTIQRHRIINREKTAKAIKESFKVNF